MSLKWVSDDDPRTIRLAGAPDVIALVHVGEGGYCSASVRLRGWGGCLERWFITSDEAKRVIAMLIDAGDEPASPPEPRMRAAAMSSLVVSNHPENYVLSFLAALARCEIGPTRPPRFSDAWERGVDATQDAIKSSDAFYHAVEDEKARGREITRLRAALAVALARPSGAEGAGA